MNGKSFHHSFLVKDHLKMDLGGYSCRKGSMLYVHTCIADPGWDFTWDAQLYIEELKSLH